ncbi:SPFH domain-containing protein [Methyloversatilis sp.]|uniref:SPFH domain-containing protein n=1 Tax=Methyloversatilis sp. TaxID=2569862 RepID=UPI0035AECBBC
MKYIKVAIVMLFAAMTTACGFIETGEVGVRKTFGKIDNEEVSVGFYTAVLSSVDTYSIKETVVDLKDLKPRALDNLSLRDLDVSVYYTVNPSIIAEFSASNAGMSAKGEDGRIYPGYNLIQRLASGEINDKVAKMESLKLHQNRDTLENDVLAGLQAQLDAKVPGGFKVTRVVVTGIQTDPAIEASIQKSIQAEKDLEIATKQVQVKQQQALANEKLTQSLTPAYLQYEYIKALQDCASSKDCTMIVDQSSSSKMLNVGR